MQSAGKNKINREANDYGIDDPVNITCATVDHETTRKPAMTLAKEQIKNHIGACETKASDQYMVREPQQRNHK